MATVEKTMMSMVIAIFGFAIMAQVVQGMAPQYQCPICAETFYSYEALYTHFTTEHPAEDIDIIWQ